MSNSNYDYQSELKQIWLTKEYGHEPDLPELDFNWQSWKGQIQEDGRRGR